MSDTPKTIHTLTPMRGIAALWVMGFHIEVCLFYRDYGGFTARDTVGILSKGYLWVDFFFILSGFILCHVYGVKLYGQNYLKEALNYVKARFFRLYPLHLFTLGLVVAFALLWVRLFPQIVDGSWDTFMAFKAIPSNLLLTHAMNQHVYLSWNIVSWSIGAEWWTNVLALTFLGPLFRARPWVIAVTTVLAGLALITLVTLVSTVFTKEDHGLDITFNYGFWRCLFEFIIGIGVYRLWRCGHFKAQLGSDLTLLATMAGIIAMLYLKVNDLGLIPTFCLLILALAHNEGWVARIAKTRVLTYLGEISYSIYLMHGVVFSVAWFSLPLLRPILGEGQLSLVEKAAFAVLFVMATLVSAALTNRLVERPMRALYKKPV